MALAAIGGWGILILLKLFTESIRIATGVHDLKVKVAQLRLERLSRDGAPHIVTVDAAPETTHRAAA